MISKTTQTAPTVTFARIPQPSGLFDCVDIWIMRARTRKALAKMSAEQMQDCALTRAEIERECAKPFWVA